MAFGVVDHAGHELAEEAVDVRLAHQQVERQLHGVGLDRGHALGAAAIVVVGLQLVPQCLDVDGTRREAW